ncbi:MAG: deoxyguanosinetriphosphate triphosphohydrolase [Oscillospiraceae bacterium]|nr:deoxyguanosinetriphosphate triphosphohydrolase [Oscillospiraceae bacterium]
MDIRTVTENNEDIILGEYAFKTRNTRGRRKEEEMCPIRTAYQRDRDRIIHSKAFRRMKHKTQVFMIPEGDHYRTRLTHTLEVMQIARTIARALRLNEDLTEAAALGHDLGHTPFGHSGEKVLNSIVPGGFTHYEQSLRVVDVLEGGDGINLTYEVRDGIVNHTGDNLAETLEGRIIKFADRFAYINHDIDDAIRAEIITQDDLPEKCISVLGKRHSERINTLICDMIENSMNKPELAMSERVKSAMMDLRSFMFENVYLNKKAKTGEDKVYYIIHELYEYFRKNKDKIPAENLRFEEKFGTERIVCDYIAGMSDDYAVHIFNEIFVPKPWNKM